MNDVQEIKFLWQLVWNGKWVIAVCFVLAVSLGVWFIYRSTPTYQATATLKINDKETGASAFLKHFESFSTTGILLTEIEVLRSRYLVGKALDKLDFDISYYQYIRSTPRELYQRSPFIINYKLKNDAYLDQMFELEYSGDSSWQLVFIKEGIPTSLELQCDSPLVTDDFELTLCLNTAYLEQDPGALFPGRYAFEIFSRDRLVSRYSGGDLVIKLRDEEVAIVRIYFNHKVPLKAQRFVNTLAEIYIEDFVENKTEAASKALNFIDSELAKATAELNNSEKAIESYKANKEILDPDLEMEGEFQKTQSLERQIEGIGLVQTQLKQLLIYVRHDSSGNTFSHDLGSVSDPIYHDGLMKLSNFHIERNKLLLKYTPAHPQIQLIDKELTTLQKSLEAAIAKTYETNQAKINELKKSLQVSQGRLSVFPNIERELQILDRQFLTKQKSYEFLLEKRTEAAIGTAATISFHKILERASLPRVPINSQRKIVAAVSAFLGIAFGLIILFGRHYLNPKLLIADEAVQLCGTPQMGSLSYLYRQDKGFDRVWFNLAANIELDYQPQVIVLNSLAHGEGKSFITEGLTQAFAAMGRKTLWVDGDLYDPSLHKNFDLPQGPGLSEWMKGAYDLGECIQDSGTENLSLLTSGEGQAYMAGLLLDLNEGHISTLRKQGFDKIIIDSPAFGHAKEARAFQRFADLNLMVIRANKTLKADLISWEKTRQESETPTFAWVWNHPKKGLRQFIRRNILGIKENKIYG